MFLSAKILFVSLIFNLAWLKSNGIIQSDETEENTKPTNQVLVFNAGTVLLPFSLYDVVPPIWKTKSGGFIDDNRYEFKSYNNVTNVLKDLKQKGFRLYAILNIFCSDLSRPYVIFPGSRGELLVGLLPEKEFVEKIFEVYGWNKLFENVIHFQNKLDDIMIRIKEESGTPLKEMMYFDNNGKYDTYIVNSYGMFRYIVRRGITYRTMKTAFAKYSNIKNNLSISF